jgi:hypothetical protein
MRIILPLIAAVLISGCSSSTPPCEDRATALAMAEDFIRQDLKDSGPAHFPDIAADGVSVDPAQLVDGHCGFDVMTYVDAPNGSGEEIRTDYVVTLAPDDTGSDWSLVEITAF